MQAEEKERRIGKGRPVGGSSVANWRGWMSHGGRLYIWNGMREMGRKVGLEGVDISNDVGGCQGVEVLDRGLRQRILGDFGFGYDKGYIANYCFLFDTGAVNSSHVAAVRAFREENLGSKLYSILIGVGLEGLRKRHRCRAETEDSSNP
jgi:hypothetical protein